MASGKSLPVRPGFSALQQGVCSDAEKRMNKAESFQVTKYNLQEGPVSLGHMIMCLWQGVHIELGNFYKERIQWWLILSQIGGSQGPHILPFIATGIIGPLQLSFIK